MKLVNDCPSNLPECPALLSSLLGFDIPTYWNDAPNLLVDLAASMRAHGRGGSMLVVPADSASWRESIAQPMPHTVAPPFAALGELVRNGGGRQHSHREVGRAVAALGGLTAIDGATVINDRHESLAFGVKIGRPDGRPRVEQGVLTEPIEGSRPIVVHPSELDETRHLSAAQFAQNQRDTVALVASQDGRFTTFAWSPCESAVHAYRVDALLI